jgi:hypothetical protein
MIGAVGDAEADHAGGEGAEVDADLRQHEIDVHELDDDRDAAQPGDDGHRRHVEQRIARHAHQSQR